MLAMIASLLASRGLSQRTAQRLAPLAAIVLLIALCGLGWGVFKAWDWWDDRQAVQADRDAANAAFRARQIEAERKAAKAKALRDQQDAGKRSQLEDRVDEADRNSDSAADDVWNGGLWD